MRTKEKISNLQMSAIFFCFMTGSSIVNIPGPLVGFAKNSAWISLIVSLSIGMLLLSCVLYLYKKFPDLTFIEYSKALVGTWITIPLAVLFISFQIHMASAIVLDIGLFMTTSMMRQTPLYIFTALIFFVVAVTVRSGIETMVRMLIVPMIVVLFFVILILVLSWTNYNFQHLLPVMPDGIKPIVLGAYFTYGFPYVELVIMAMLLPYVRKEGQKNIKKYMYLSLLLNGGFLIAVTLSSILVFGPMAGERKYSMFEVARTIDMFLVIQRIESLMGISLIMTAFMKAAITLFILNLTLTKLLNLQDERILVFPLALSCFFLSLIEIKKGEAHWVNIVTLIHPLWGTAAYLLPLLVLTIVALIKKKVL